MRKGILSLVVLLAALTASFLVVTMSDDSDAFATHDEFAVRGPEPGMQAFDAPMDPKGMDPFQPKQFSSSLDDRRDMGPRGPMDGPVFGQDHGMRVPPAPEMKAPGYSHDATPEQMEEMIPVMVENDISIFDPGFVEDAIDYAKDNGMEGAADILSKKLQDYLSVLRTINAVSSADTRANGMDLDDQNEDDPITVEEVEDEEPVPFVPSDDDSSPISPVFVCSPVMVVCIQLDL